MLYPKASLGRCAHGFSQKKKALLMMRPSPSSSLMSSSLKSIHRMMSSTTPPVVEVREYALKVHHAAAFWQSAAETADLRRTMLPLRFFSRPETGGRLNVATHVYYYENGQEEREIRRQALDRSPEWKSFKFRTSDFILEQESNLYVEAPFIRDKVFPQVKGLATTPDAQSTNSDTSQGDDSHNSSILELRRYQLQLGYDTVPKFLDLYTSGLPSKLEAPGTDPTTSLLTVFYTEVGTLNEVWEIWHHGRGNAAMEASRQAARQATEWKQAIANIAPLALKFQTTIHRPCAFSPFR